MGTAWQLQEVTITADTANYMDGVDATVWFVNESTNQIVATCADGYSCAASVTSYNGGDVTFDAFVAGQDSDGNPEAPIAVSEPVTVTFTRSPVSLSASTAEVPAGDAVELDASSQVDIGGSPYLLLIWDDTANSLVAGCMYGTECNAVVYGASPGQHRYTAFIAVLDDGFSSTSDQQSDDAPEVNILWDQASIALESSTLSAYQTAPITLTATTSIDVATLPYSIFILDQDSNTVIGLCAAGNTCQVLTTGDSPAVQHYVAFVGSYDYQNQQPSELYSALSQPIAITYSPVPVTLTTDQATVYNQRSVQLTMTSPVDPTVSNYSLMIVDTDTNDLVAWCGGGTQCITSVIDIGPITDHFFAEIGQEYTDGNGQAHPLPDSIQSTSADDVSVSWLPGVASALYSDTCTDPSAPDDSDNSYVYCLTLTRYSGGGDCGCVQSFARPAGDALPIRNGKGHAKVSPEDSTADGAVPPDPVAPSATCSNPGINYDKTRTQACTLTTGVLTKYRVDYSLFSGINVEVGWASFDIADYLQTYNDSPNWYAQEFISPISAGGDDPPEFVEFSGQASSMQTEFCAAACSDTSDEQQVSYYPAVLKMPTPDDDDPTDEVTESDVIDLSEPADSITSGQIADFASEITYNLEADGVADMSSSDQLDTVRCDDDMTSDDLGPVPPGCILPNSPPPVMNLDPTDSTPDLDAHIQQAQDSGLVGAPNESTLTRVASSYLADANRNYACPRNNNVLPRPDGFECDEYPFASTEQGASFAAYEGGLDVVAGPRTFDGCQINLSRFGSSRVTNIASGPSGYSICMVPKPQNRSGGIVVNNFYRNFRIQRETDPFYVNPDPSLNWQYLDQGQTGQADTGASAAKK